jgi:hypothetical protein
MNEGATNLDTLPLAQTARLGPLAVRRRQDLAATDRLIAT